MSIFTRRSTYMYTCTGRCPKTKCDNPNVQTRAYQDRYRHAQGYLDLSTNVWPLVLSRRSVQDWTCRGHAEYADECSRLKITPKTQKGVHVATKHAWRRINVSRSMQTDAPWCVKHVSRWRYPPPCLARWCIGNLFSVTGL